MRLLPFSKRRTTPLMSSPLRSLNSLKMRSRSSSRTRWMSTCLAVCAAMRPKAWRACLTLQDVAELLVLLGGLLGVVRGARRSGSRAPRPSRRRGRALRVLDGDLAVVVGHVVDDGHVLEEVDLAGVLVEAGLELAVGAEDALGGLEDGLFDRLDEARLVDPLVLRDHLDRLKEGEIAGPVCCCWIAMSVLPLMVPSNAMLVSLAGARASQHR